MRERLQKLQEAMSQLPQASCLQTRHWFADGMYCRELFRPAGTLIVGKVHKREHLYIICSGSVRVVLDGDPQDITGPCVMVSQAGVKRAVLALTDATCVTIHRTDSTDLDAIERELVEPDETALFDSSNHPKLLA